MWGSTQETNNTEQSSGWGNVSEEKTSGTSDPWGQPETTENQFTGGDQGAQRGGGRGRGGRGGRGRGRGDGEAQEPEREKYVPIVSDGWFLKKKARKALAEPFPQDVEVILIPSDDESNKAKEGSETISPGENNKTGVSMDLEII